MRENSSRHNLSYDLEFILREISTSQPVTHLSHVDRRPEYQDIGHPLYLISLAILAGRGTAPSPAAAASAGSQRARGASEVEGGVRVADGFGAEQCCAGMQGCSGFGLQDVALMPVWGEEGFLSGGGREGRTLVSISHQ